MELHAQAEAAELLQPGRTSGQSHVHTLGSFSHISSSPRPDGISRKVLSSGSEGFCSYQLPSMDEPDEGKVHRFQENKGGGGEIQEKRGERVHAGSALEDGRSLRVNEEKEL